MSRLEGDGGVSQVGPSRQACRVEELSVRDAEAGSGPPGSGTGKGTSSEVGEGFREQHSRKT